MVREEEDMNAHDAREKEEFMDALRFGLVPCENPESMEDATHGSLRGPMVREEEDMDALRF